MARSSEYSETITDIICERIANGESLKAICDEEGQPDKSTVFRWLAAHESFRDKYARAREAQADALFDEILQIADTPIIGEKTKTDKDGNVEITTGDMIEHRRLQVDARKWMAGKLRPKKYGEKIELEHGVTDEVSQLMDKLNGRTRGLPNGS